MYVLIVFTAVHKEFIIYLRYYIRPKIDCTTHTAYIGVKKLL